MLEVVKDSLAKGRKCLVYTVYTDTRDTTGRLKEISNGTVLRRR
ncbi:Uncharacterised protein [Neisseria gonorrhoeae]|uniref:Uncharacterized protein n=1 Tax=Neisseria gonorrhoeae TaxID=485 RepID=A0A378VZ61_NEIGO|nr:Uncharacterised protein [Neisseria gonorrhoeae]